MWGVWSNSILPRMADSADSGVNGSVSMRKDLPITTDLQIMRAMSVDT
jgi:hypothetical protein